MTGIPPWYRPPPGFAGPWTGLQAPPMPEGGRADGGGAILPGVQRPAQEESLDAAWRRLARTPSLGQSGTLKQTSTNVAASVRLADLSLPYPDDIAVYVGFDGFDVAVLDSLDNLFPCAVRVTLSSGASNVVYQYPLRIAGQCFPLRTARATVDLVFSIPFLPNGTALPKMQAGQGWRFTCAVGRGTVNSFRTNENYNVTNPATTLPNPFTAPVPALCSKVRLGCDDVSAAGAGSSLFEFLGPDNATAVYTLSPNGVVSIPGTGAGRYVDIPVPRNARSYRVTMPGAALTTSNISLEWEGLA